MAELSRMAEEQIVRAPDQKRERTIPTLWDWCRFMRESMGVKMDEHDMRRKYYELFPKAPRGDDTPEISKA